LVSQNAAAASATLTTNQTAYLAGRNRIINGACSVAQRASVSVTGAQVYGQCDRWTGIIYGSAGGAHTLDQAAIALNSVNRFWVRETVTTPVTSLTGSNGWGGIQQLIEGFNSHDLLGKQVTISFWFVSNVTGNFSVALRDAPTSFSYITSFAATANVPVKVSFTTPTLPTGLSVPYSTAAGLVLSVGALSTGTLQCATGSLNTWASGTFVSAQGATNWGTTNGNFIAITDVQLEEGSVATPFERRQYGEEFALCQRYYEAGQTNVMQSPSTASAVGSQVKFSVAKRSPPTIALVRQFSSGAIPATSLSASPTSESVLVYVVTTAGGVMQAQDAWTASAEL
jgi:hypothetical protein